MLPLKQRLAMYRVIPVVTPTSVDATLLLAEALSSGGIGAIEITLRTPAALDALRAVKDSGIAIEVGVGTVTTPALVEEVAKIGVAFAISPGLTRPILDAAAANHLELLPGIASPSELMLGLEYGLDFFKLFPAEVVGGQKMLKALSGPFPSIQFCPTGGISPANARDYLSLPNVACIGGSWMVPQEAIEAGDWSTIERLSREAIALTSA
ncbi:MAG: bifunctional 4-hydroxy-2-oxoglutarate aldolase/2-dehydro-3-deoxy-phosphogluconate aldolase [Gammaproteobacteria bacterium]|nr:bifunctional 4-hydroxy-2-oxoglutarate aldolase/2-dehydro-3-deoxy-phosphogluconate aldolase [Gammaproteobacteria bacterium]